MTDIVTHNDRIATIGMDLGKRSFHLIGMDEYLARFRTDIESFIS